MFLQGRYPETYFFTFINVVTVWHMVQRTWYFIIKTPNMFYLIDYCYLNLVLCMYFINFDPHNEQLFRLAYFGSTGGVLMATILCRNKLALHNF